MYALQTKNVRKTYKTRKKETQALKGIDLRIRKGEIFGLLGPNGAGKTTFIKICTTLLGKTEGEVKVLGFDIDKNEKEIRKRIGYIGQDSERSTYARLTGRENLEFFATLYNVNKEEFGERLEEFKRTYENEEIFDKQVMKLSGGQKQAIVVMRGFLHNPDLVFADEISKGLDPIAAKKIRNFVRDYAKEKGKTILITSQIMSEIEELCDRVAIIHEGKVVAVDTPQNLMDEIDLQLIELRMRSGEQVTPDFLQVLTTIDSIYDIQQENGFVKLSVTESIKAFESVMEICNKYNLNPIVSYRTATLEDVFLRYCDKKVSLEE
ncbi:MAG: ATP-binding cassette domain-containing protein [Candidatus Heimdallarchaeota archaeon]|nr:ATP-binding cassette domain-containing protein [Candidatus Heimdallarchaeota archaeon]